MARGNPFAGEYDLPAPLDVRIPKRHREAAGWGASGTTSTKREVGVGLDGGPAPPIGSMGEEEYAEWVRAGMYRLKHRAEVEERERLAKVKEEAERAKESARERAMKSEKKRLARLRAEKSAAVEEGKRGERERYRVRWKALGEVGGDVEESELTFGDIPWPAYRPVTMAGLAKGSVREFLLALAADGEERGAEGEGERVRRVLREAIRVFHPDRFFGRVLGRVREGEREQVKDGVERCSRIINDLAAENRAA